MNSKKTTGLVAGLVMTLVFCALTFKVSAQKLNPSEEIRYCTRQAVRTLKELPAPPVNLPRSINNGSQQWHCVSASDWCSGFWPGILWYLYEGTGNTFWKMKADTFSRQLAPVLNRSSFDHDLGFMFYDSYGNGYRLTHRDEYKAILLRAADSLATLFNPKVGTILSWPAMRKKMNWPHNTIIDNMMNLELLFWAAKHGGDHRLYDIAVKHAETTMHNHFRKDFSAYHVVVYDTVSGKKIKGVTHQGYSDSSMWARGQSWAIYGFTMCYRETHRKEFLDFAQKVAEVYLKRLPADLIPYWDFNAPEIPNAPRDASAAAVTASALLDLSTYVQNTTQAKRYYRLAVAMLSKLSSASYQSRNVNSAFLLHSTGHHPAGTEIDASIIYADYYYLEALIKMKKMAGHTPSPLNREN